MNNTFIPPELQETILQNVTDQNPSDWDIYSIGNELYRVTLPDGRELTVDSNGNIVG